jgi:hypothetical protein
MKNLDTNIMKGKKVNMIDKNALKASILDQAFRGEL